MGIKRVLTSSQLPTQYQNYPLIPTQNGVMATVYLLGDSFVLKLFEPNSHIEGEIKLLNSLSGLPIPKIVDIFELDTLQAVIYTQIEGVELTNPKPDEVAQIGAFLREFHQKTENFKLETPNLFERKRLKGLIAQTQNSTLANLFEELQLSPNGERVIHGDLFLDNARFRNGKLSGVFDFSDACMGDRDLDLGIVAISWCFNGSSLDREKLNALSHGYGKVVREEYIRYGLLYYATTRYLSGRNYRELLERF
jgi:homoserine kinase type II